MDPKLFEKTDRWLCGTGDNCGVAVSSRARFARNLAGYPYVPHARGKVLENVEAFIRDGIGRAPRLKAFERLELSSLSREDRGFLKESRLISKEMERAIEHRAAWINPEESASILINEEDHIRIQVIRPALRVQEAVGVLKELDEAMAEVAGYAWSEKYGHLTACPTNAGTGFRASVMLHLPGLKHLKELEASLQGTAHHGLTVRGFDGENSDSSGDFFQISNEVTMGSTVEEILETLKEVVERLIAREEEARLELFRHHETAVADSVWRAYGVLAYARRIDSAEAMRLLSMIRLGIDKGWFGELDHATLNRLVLEIQPAHLQRRRSDGGDTHASRDEARAAFLREHIRAVNGLN